MHKSLLYLLMFNVLTIIWQTGSTQPVAWSTYYHIKTDSHQPNNRLVPETITASSQFERILIIRLKHGKDLLTGLEDAVSQEKFSNGVIINGIGSLTQYHLHAVSNSTFPSENDFYKEEQPVDLISVAGYIIDGRIHAHISVSDRHGAVGGHLEPDTRVFTFAIITVGILPDDIDISRFDDKTWR